MVASGARVLVHVVDPIPAVIVARVLDGLRALGIDPELLGVVPAGPGFAHRAAPRVVLARERDGGGPRPECDAVVVTLPAQPTHSGIDRSVADGVLAQVVAALARMAPAV